MTPPDLNAFAQYIPGFEFLQNLTRQAAGSVAPGLQSGVPGMPSMSHWVAPTFDVEELDKRIQDLRAVHFWLDQNTKALGATIQALEVQKMTLATLKGMNVSLGEMAEAFKIRPEAATPEQPAAQPPAPTPEEAPARPMVDPMQWWNSLTEQFQTIATGAVRDMADQASRAAEQVAQTVQASAEAASQMSASAATPPAAEPPPRPARAPKAPAAGRKPRASTAFAQPAAQGARKPAAKKAAPPKPAPRAR